MTTILHRRAVLTKMTIHGFTNERVDADASIQAGLAYMKPGAQSGTGMIPRVVKNIFPKHAIRGVTHAEHALRTFHRKRTMPWDDGGWRLLPSAHFLQYTKDIAPLKTAFYTAVNLVADNLDHLKNMAEVSSKLYREDEYPSADEIRSAFQVDIRFNQLADTGDFRLDSMDEASDMLRKEFEATQSKNLSGSVTSHLTHMYSAGMLLKQRLADPKAKLYQSVLQNLVQAAQLGKDLEAMLPAAAQQGAFDRIIDIFEACSMDDLRHDENIRRQTTVQLTGVLDDIRRSNTVETSLIVADVLEPDDAA